MTTPSTRTPENEVAPLFISRWSSRSFTGETIPDSVLFSSIEAARWAPSAANAQPWRFIYAKRDSADWSRFLGLVFENNAVWAKNASALVLLVSRTQRQGEKGLIPHHSHSFDTGAAWENFALQASQLGWSTRAIGGFDREKAKQELEIPDGFAIEVLIAIGKPAASAPA